ncbi:Protease inhibitor Inh [Bosea sp. 62]|uniref:AprI/Inh family metalloprotease inhibitor n=1 Tax=unclassified Bosea (in: a-proteobacteria) TaxID=2653178 RepID=UPI0012538387|nr:MULTISPECIES: AprI/Inh family metalloprotease inhibitor [unclassified Bosea (in: a-proteobacteria)]CAD5250918.1 Protease inhibitor Inh [Bosea sp. 21B]CAD5262842.1 Protease inhibitor Inh [Bosea sp. 7B]CAD5271818.1 Protease inhibitor Inh [Bosea sp. 46]VVT43807.1 Protease inhibitor Inh [Bosea sp. EC-HK365B]VXB19180.1 Protease inhibitor Inh [Bosea sp. 29B]
MDKSLIKTGMRWMQRGVAIAALALLAALPVGAQTQSLPRGAEKAPEGLKPFIGAWDLEKLGSARECTVTFGAETAGQGRQVRFPATCRRALPILTGVVAWDVADGAPRLLDGHGKPVIVFSGKADPGRRGKGSDGAEYGLDPAGYVRAQQRPAPGRAELAATAAARPTAVDPASAPAAGSVPGRYTVMRQAGRDVCKLVLSTNPSANAGASVASFDGLCPDTGLTIFSPVAWRYEAGRLELIARKGHKVELVFEGGQWRKDPAVGAPLLLKKLP